ncbi:sensor histidine kinase [Sphaerotilus mobilis]|uniref:histidine kinase n=1 Tax=Sphaerotilus mobilis TaxID=47994 RepID=A0A4Q7LWR0_9BURK|nr:sensor histidine kinase [Sphaerotilus mobilis]RZS58578.1 two-component system sensor histidine kinase TctE [Sphaerotilus mobilis]
MRWNPLPRRTLRSRLLGLLLPGMVLLLAASLWNTRHDAISAADAAFDRSLLGALKGLDLNVTTASGGLAVEQPYRLFEFFQLSSGGEVHYRVATDDGLVEIGSPDLPLPPPDVRLRSGEPRFYDAVYFGEPVRVGALRRELDPPVGDARQVLIQVAEGTASRERFAQTFVRQALWRDASMLGLMALAVAAVAGWALRPVQRLAAVTRSRQTDDLRPLQADGLPEDLQPLVEAINQQLARTQALVEQRRQFLDDASHQLRTPLTTLRAQLDYARREADPARLREALDALSTELDLASRSTNQLLLLARADAAPLQRQPVDLAELAREVALQLLQQARALGVDFGIALDESAEPALIARGDRLQLREAWLNLAHNALVHGCHAGAGGRVTLEAGHTATGWQLGVVDDGVGLDPDVAGRLGERFAKGRGSRGAGLGLAMARSVIERHGGQLVAQAGDGGRGLRIQLQWGST